MSTKTKTFDLIMGILKRKAQRSESSDESKKERSKRGAFGSLGGTRSGAYEEAVEALEDNSRREKE